MLVKYEILPIWQNQWPRDTTGNLAYAPIIYGNLSKIILLVQSTGL